MFQATAAAATLCGYEQRALGTARENIAPLRPSFVFLRCSALKPYGGFHVSVNFTPEPST